ncbi:MAG: SH3 domain-containing protein, partial [Clostridia bacterium]|nr:SH3 domain-containing protein [Clostridia bacterium]
MKRTRTRRFLYALACLGLLLAALPIRPARAETALATGYVNSATLNMRAGPNTSYAIQDTLTRNTAVNIYAVSGTWLRIDVPATGKSGYVSGKYISVNASSLSAYGLGVTTGQVHLRREGTTRSESLAIIAKNSGVTVFFADPTTGWYRVRVHDGAQEGYISQRYVTVVCRVVDNGGTAGSGTATGSYINASGVNFRSGPGTNYTSQGKLSKNTAVTVTGSSGNWYRLTVNATGKSGYVFSRYVTLGSSGEAVEQPPAAGSAGYINADAVNFRSGPGTNYASQGRLSKNTAVTVAGSSGDWYRLTVNATGKSGYVFSR